MFKLRLKTAFAVFFLLTARLETARADDAVISDNVGILIELTGAGAPVADDCKKGLFLGAHAWPAVPGRKIELRYGDSQDDAKTALSEFRRLTQIEEAEAVVVVRSKIAMPLNPLSEQLKIPLIGGVGHPRFITDNPYAVRFYPNAESEAALLAKTALAAGHRRFASLVVEDEYQLALQGAFEREVKQRGGKVVYSGSVSPTEMDFAATILRIRAAAPDAVFASFLFTQEGVFLKRLREQGVASQVFSNYWIQKKEVIETSGIAAVEHSVFVEVDTGKPQFTSLAEKHYPGIRITPSIYLCYALYSLLLQAQRDAGPDGSFRDALQKVSVIQTPDGNLRVSKREVELAMRARIIRNGEPQELK